MHVVFVREAPPTISPPYVLRTTSQFFLRNHGARPAQGAGILPMFVPYATASPFHLRPPPGSSGKMRDRHRVGAGQGTDPPPNTNCLNRQSGSHKDRGKHIMGSANPWAVPYNNLDSHSLSLYPSIPLSRSPSLVLLLLVAHIAKDKESFCLYAGNMRSEGLCSRRALSLGERMVPW